MLLLIGTRKTQKHSQQGRKDVVKEGDQGEMKWREKWNMREYGKTHTQFKDKIRMLKIVKR